MPVNLSAKPRPPWGLILLVLAQILCAGFFLADVIGDFGRADESRPHLSIEMLAGAVLIVSVVVLIRVIVSILRRQAHLERAAGIASAAIAEVIEAHFAAWRLTPAEHDVANLMVKGLSIAEIADIRGSAEGTVKAHLNAIYRKSGCQNRGELLSRIIDSLMERDATG